VFASTVATANTETTYANNASNTTLYANSPAANLQLTGRVFVDPDANTLFDGTNMAVA
jgi:hypothetical protein